MSPLPPVSSKRDAPRRFISSLLEIGFFLPLKRSSRNRCRPRCASAFRASGKLRYGGLLNAAGRIAEKVWQLVRLLAACRLQSHQCFSVRRKVGDINTHLVGSPSTLQFFPQSESVIKNNGSLEFEHWLEARTNRSNFTHMIKRIESESSASHVACLCILGLSCSGFRNAAALSFQSPTHPG
jgi:hypothetical protein